MAGEAHRPPVVAVSGVKYALRKIYCITGVPIDSREVLADDVRVLLHPDHRPGHDEREDAGLVLVVEAQKAVKQRHRSTYFMSRFPRALSQCPFVRELEPLSSGTYSYTLHSLTHSLESRSPSSLRTNEDKHIYLFTVRRAASVRRPSALLYFCLLPVAFFLVRPPLARASLPLILRLEERASERASGPSGWQRQQQQQRDGRRQEE